MITPAIPVGPAPILRQSADDEQFLFERLQRLQDVGQFEIGALHRGSPVGHVRAVRHEHEGHALWGADAAHTGKCLRRRKHCIQHR